ncbi:MAG: RDD family protein [Acidobacteriaceae bacterium]|nr:RDD family protein [Acidobacteriaceae bacterium]
MEWYYADSGQRAGPVPESELQSLYATGKVRRDTLVWTAGMAEWQRLERVKPDWMNNAPDAGLAPTNSRDGVDAPTVIAAEFRARAGRRYAGFWIRFLARCIDGLILSVVYIFLGIVCALLARPVLPHLGEGPQAGEMVVLWAGLGVMYLISSACFVAYEAWFLRHRGATPGKLALGLRVIRSDGSPLSAGRSVGRAFGYLLDGLIPLAIGFIIAAFDVEKRALHDHLCDTRVVHTSP